MNKKELHDKIITLLERTEKAVRQQDVSSIIDCMNGFCIDNRRRSVLEEYASQICIETITEYIKTKNLSYLRISRKNEYNDNTFDRYVLDEGILKRNGTDVKWSSLGKLYTAYKQIIKKKDYGAKDSTKNRVRKRN